MRSRSLLWLCSAVCAALALPLDAAEITLHWPLGRTVYQTNEDISLAVVRESATSLEAGPLVVTLTGADASRLTFTFAAPKILAQNGTARGTEHLRFRGWLLRPGAYNVTVAVDGAQAGSSFEVFTHLRHSSFKLICWGRAKGPQQLFEGDLGLGFNLFYGHYARDDNAEFLKAGVDFMPCCVMGGGHQMDLRAECDWSDPRVLQGGQRRVVKSAFQERTRPHVPGSHFYDEPGLTWARDPATGKMSPHGVPSQYRSYESAFGHAPPTAGKVDANSPEQVRQWLHWARWKLGFMDAAWQDAQFGVSYVRPDYLSVTQSQYGYTAFADGYYFNVVRSLPITSGHGGYHDWGPGYFNPSLFLEMARARDWDKPCWYLPTWYGNTTTDEYRLEQYLAFQTHLQGLSCPPDIDPFEPEKRAAAAGVIESNRLAGRLGTIFTTSTVTRPPVALLFSLSHNLRKQARDQEFNYAHADAHGSNLTFAYLAGKLLQQPFLTVLEEDVRDGTLAAHHKAIVLTSIADLDPEVLSGLEAFARQGGLVLKTSDCQVQVEGAIDLGITPGWPDADQIHALTAAGKTQEAAKLQRLRQALVAADKLAQAIKPHLEKAGIAPVLGCDQPGISATRQVSGDVEYLFLVNAAHDPQGENAMLALQPVAAKLTLPNDGRPIYDAVLGGIVKQFQSPKMNQEIMEGAFRLGPGQMRVFARTTRPIGTVRLSAPQLVRDYTKATQPLALHLGAVMLDQTGQVLSGSFPLQIQVVDPLGVVRHDLARATDRGMLTLSVPLAANDAPGSWIVRCKDHVGGTEAVVSFAVPVVTTCGAVAGRVERAVWFEPDRKNCYRFARLHQRVDVIYGKEPHEKAAAERVQRILAPWGIVCRLLPATDVKPRSLNTIEAPTWVGLSFGKAKVGENPPAMSGFSERAPAILIGTPQSHAQIAFLAEQKFLPYPLDPQRFPGRGRGHVAWQFDGLGNNQESVTLIGYDEPGLQEAVGSFYEAVAGMDPLTRDELPAASTIAFASKSDEPHAATIAWEARLPDRITGLSLVEGQVVALSHDRSRTPLKPTGEVLKSQVLDAAAYAQSAHEAKWQNAPDLLQLAQAQARPGRRVKFVLPVADFTAVVYWGGRVELRDREQRLVSANVLTQDVTAVLALDNLCLVGLADGRVLALRAE